MDAPISRGEHEEFMRRMETESQRLADEDNRQNKRLDMLENNVNQIIVNQLMSITTAIEKLNNSVNSILQVQTENNERIKKLEARDGDLWRTAVKYVLSALIGGAIAFAFTKLGG